MYIWTEPYTLEYFFLGVVKEPPNDKSQEIKK